MGETMNAYRTLVGKPEGKRPLGRPRLRSVDNIKMYLGEIGWNRRDWIELAQDRDQWRQLLRKGSAPYVSKYLHIQKQRDKWNYCRISDVLYCTAVCWKLL
jgi:hypothetical protein